MGIETLVAYKSDSPTVAVNVACADIEAQREVVRAIAALLAGRGYLVDEIASGIPARQSGRAAQAQDDGALRARWDALVERTHAAGDELLTMSAASKLSGQSLSALRQMSERGELMVYPDPGEPNPTKRNRVKRSAVLALSKPRRRATTSKRARVKR